MNAMVHLGRARLPDRRQGRTVSAVWNARGRERPIDVSAGFFPGARVGELGRIGEVFAGVGKPDSTIDTMLDEGCQLISRLLQRRVGLAEIAKGMAFDDAGRPETPRGVVGAALIEGEKTA